jgi:hypothetical protein
MTGIEEQISPARSRANQEESRNILLRSGLSDASEKCSVELTERRVE